MYVDFAHETAIIAGRICLSDLYVILIARVLSRQHRADSDPNQSSFIKTLLYKMYIYTYRNRHFNVSFGAEPLKS